MKCRVCRGPGAIKIARHNTIFCAIHFKEHILRQVSRVIQEYKMFFPQSRILLGVSGGKDSMALWKVLTDLNYNVQAVHLNNGFGNYSLASESIVRSFAEKEGLPLRVYSLEELMGFSFEKLRRYSGKALCSLCGTIRRYYLNRMALELGCEVLVTGHNLDDETSSLLGNVLYWQRQYLRSKHPVLEAERSLVRKVKPLVKLTDEELQLYADMCDLTYLRDTCPWARGATSHFYKEIMNTIERESPGAKSSFYFGYLNKMVSMLAPEGEKNRKVAYCESCGYRTIKEGKCFICTLREKVEHA